MDQYTPQEPNQQPDFAKKITNLFLLAALRGKNTWLALRYLGGIVLIFIFLVIGQIISSLLSMLTGMLIKSGDASGKINIDTGLSIDKNLFLVYAILSFIIGIVGIGIVLKYVHNRTFLSIITPYKKVNWKKIAIAFFIYLLLSGSVEYYFYLANPENYVMHFNLARFLVLLAVVVLLLPFQTSFEELYFRGYMLQGFGLLFRSGFPAAIITAVLFALMHSGNPEVAKFGFWTMFPFYFSFGLMLGFVTIIDKGLEIPLAVHAANNMFGALFITFEGSALETDAIFYQKEMDPVGTMPYYLGIMFIFLLICTFVFGWWKKKANSDTNNFV